MHGFAQRFWLVLPWMLNIWIFAKAVNGEMHWLLAIFLLMIFIPLAALLNIVASVYFKGRELFSSLQPKDTAKKDSPKRTTVVNYADLPWWSPKKWTNR